MSSQTPYITADVVATLNDESVPFGNDLSMTFTSLFAGSLAVFQGFLGKLQIRINSDPNLPLTTPLDWTVLPGTPTQTFSMYYLDRSINELILALDKVLSHSPYA